MQPSPYLHIIPHLKNPDLSILCSFPKGAVVIVPTAAASAIRAGNIPDEAAQQLASLGIMVDDQTQEKEKTFGFFEALNKASIGLRISIILSLECNFDCRYCYEGTMKGKHHMTDETALQLVEFLKSRFQETHQKIILDFYGGEPLLSTERIIFIAEKIKPFVEENGGGFEFTLVTNGSLLKKSTVEKLKPYGLTKARVTLDGPPEIHNFYRPFKNGTESFDCIINNIKEACESIQVAIGGNFTQKNYRRFPELLDILLAKGLTPNKLAQIKFTQAMQTGDEFALQDFQDGCSCPSDPWVAEATLYLREEILKRGYKTPKLGPATCMIEIPNSLAIHYDGSIYKCTGVIGHKEFAIGEIWNGTYDYRDIYGLDSWRKDAKCKECNYLPLCFGGCRFAKLQSDGNMNQVNCMKGFLDSALTTMIQQDVLYPGTATSTERHI